jgi:hypothetical protein
MGTYGKLATAGSIAAVLFAVGAMPASAACTRLSFSVNDYGKDGPTKDAKDLLDKYIVKKMTEKGIAKYTVGKKTVNCELFLDFIVFDEHTCTAEASVCWGDQAAPKAATSAAAPAKAAPKKTSETDAKAPAEKSVATPIVPPAAEAAEAATGDHASDHSAKLAATAKQAAEAAKAAKEAAANAQAAADAAEAAAVAASERAKAKGAETTTGSTTPAPSTTTTDDGPPVQLAPSPETEQHSQETDKPAPGQATP